MAKPPKLKPEPTFVPCDLCGSPRLRDGVCRACLKRNAEYRARYCIRGCTELGPLMNDGEHAPAQPRPRIDDALICSRCDHQLRRWLAEIPDLYATLDSVPEGGLSAQYDGKSSKSGKISHSPSLILLAVAALTDRRTKRDYDTKGEPVYIPRVVCGWAELFAKEQNLKSPTRTIVEATDLLNSWWSTVIQQQWIDEMWETMHEVSTLLHRAHGHERPHQVGTCIAIVGYADDMHVCGTRLLALQGEEVRCPSCKRKYDGMELVRIADNRNQAERSISG